MIHKIKHHSKRIGANIINRIKGFTLIELLIVVAVLGILAAAVLVAINPGKRTAQARDAQRRQDIGAIANALTSYFVLTGTFPIETNCDTSIGPKGSAGCPPPAPTGAWAPNVRIDLNLVTDQGLLKKLPIDPINNTTYYYSYEPKRIGGTFCGAGPVCDYYWIGARLESPDNPAKPIFRCSDDPLLATRGGIGCKEVSDEISDETPDDNSPEQ